MKNIFFILFMFVSLFFLGCTSKKTETELPKVSESSATVETTAENVQIVDLTAENFDAFIQSEEKVLVDFWAPWCGPCMKQGELLHVWAEAGKLPVSAKIGKVNVDQESALSEQFQIRAIPALYIFQKGEIIQQFQGVQDETTIVEALQ